MNAPDVTVIIPVYNGVKFLAETVESAVTCDENNLTVEVLVIDDGSKDGSKELAERLEQDNPAVRLLCHPNSENRGVSASRSLGINEARGKYIAFLDADDVFMAGKLEAGFRELEANDSIVMVHTGVEYIDGQSSLIEPMKGDWFAKSPDSKKGYSFLRDTKALQRNHICNSTALFRRQSVIDIPLSIPQLYQHEDWLLWCLLAEKGLFLFIPEKLVQYRVHESSFTSRMHQSKLIPLYSRMEFLLSLQARASNTELKNAAKEQLGPTIKSLEGIYRSEEDRDTDADHKPSRLPLMVQPYFLSYWFAKIEKKIWRLLRRKS